MSTVTFKIEKLTEDGDFMLVKPLNWGKSYRCPKDKSADLYEGLAITAWLAGGNITHWKPIRDKRQRYPRLPQTS
jgi:hypothetical protein